MVLVTGGTGFVGRALLKVLAMEGREVGCLLRPSRQAPALPQGTFRVETGTLQDLPSLRTALQGVDTIIHLAGARRAEGQYSAEWINQQGAVNLVTAARDASVRRIVFLSHMHADRNSAFPLLRGKGAAEEAIRSSGLNYTILRCSLVFGPGDSFTSVLAMLMKVMPLAFPVTGDGKTRFQPIHVDDVAACLVGCLDTHHLDNTTLPVGGPQHLSYAEILNAVMRAVGVRRFTFHVRMPVMRTLVGLTEALFPNPPVSREQLDLFSIDNTTDLGNVPRNFHFEPLPFTEGLEYLRRPGWRKAFFRHVFRGEN